jgi:hypothetical protein
MSRPKSSAEVKDPINLSSCSARTRLEQQMSQTLTQLNTPARALGEEWHYGYRVWLDCRSATYNSSETEFYSSPGAFGTYPFINVKNNYFGIVARQGAIGTFKNGKAVFDSVRDIAKEWANCVK